MSALREGPVDEHDLYPIHEEDNVPVNPEHEAQARYLRDAVSVRLPQHRVTGEMCMYWERGNFQRYVAPDLVVIEGTTERHTQAIYLAWSDPPALFVAEVSSKSTFLVDEGPKVERYLVDLHVQEYLYYDRLRPRMRLWRAEGGMIVEAAVNEHGRMVSRTLDLEFGVDSAGFLRVYERDGRMLLNHAEMHQRAEQAHQRAEQESQRAEQESQRANELEEELLRLRAALARREDSGPGAD